MSGSLTTLRLPCEACSITDSQSGKIRKTRRGSEIRDEFEKPTTAESIATILLLHLTLHLWLGPDRFAQQGRAQPRGHRMERQGPPQLADPGKAF